MIRILHIIDSLNGAGPTRSLISIAKYATEQGMNQEHRVITLRAEAYPVALLQAKRAGIAVLRKPDQEVMTGELAWADIVQMHYWNNPAMSEFMRRELPAMRLLLWLKILGEHPPQVITSELLDFSDFVVATSPFTPELPLFRSWSEKWNHQNADVIYGMADWSRLADLQPRPHTSFNVGYIGTVNFTKMHPRYVPMSAGMSIPDIKFIVCGGGIEDELQQQAAALGAVEKFDFRGYVENIKPVLETLDVFGYPLCEDTYATSEKSIQEAMYAGVPPVVFSHGGCKDLVKHEVTGLIVNNESEYQQAIEYLYHNPDFRLQLGRNAAEYARKVFNSEKAVLKMHEVYERMMKFPKRRRNWKYNVTFQETSPGASFFVQTLGDSAPQFQISMSEEKTEDLFEAEEKIANSSSLLAGGEGGINQYRNTYPDDPYLRLWSGLVLQKRQRHSTALKEFDAAINLGLTHWRIHWYKVNSAFQMNDKVAARSALNKVIRTAPDFTEAQDLWERISDMQSERN